MPKPKKNARRGWNLTLASHILVYTLMWFIAVYALSTLPIVRFSANYTHFIALVLLWLPFLALHIVAHIVTGRQITSVENERDAYRQGFADAARELADSQDSMIRLALNDEGELLELPEKPKRTDEVDFRETKQAQAR